MRRAVLLAAAAVLLAGPTALAFFAGGYFDEPRLIATLVAWAGVLVVAVAAPRPLPRSRGGLAALGGLFLIVVWTGISIAWAPLSEPATASFVRVLLYLGALVAAVALLRDRLAREAVEPVLALGTLVVIGYGLAGRLLPGIVHLTQSAKANGRLEQPITYWNAEGALAAIGFVLCARLAASDSRPPAVRILAAAATAPLGLGIYLSYSRGAIAAAVAGLIVLLAAAPSWSQLRAVGLALAAGVVTAAACSGFPEVTSLEGTAAEREGEGAAALAIVMVVMLVAGAAQWWMVAAQRRGRLSTATLGFARRLPALAAVAVAVALVGLLIGGLGERADDDDRQGAARLASVESRRYDYWRVGVRAFASHPLQGVGAAGFRVEWLRERPVAEAALETHSLPLEMATELGIPGLLGFALLVGGVGAAAGGALRRHPALAPGACAGVTVWFLHAAIDWDWQLPAVTLPAIVMGGALVAASETASEPDRAIAPVSRPTRAG